MRCEACSQSFEPRRRDQRYCSARCRLAGYHRRQGAKQAEALAERDAKVRRLLEEARGRLDWALRALGDKGGGDGYE